VKRLALLIVLLTLGTSARASAAKVDDQESLDPSGHIDIGLVISSPGSEDPRSMSSRPLLEYTVSWAVESSPAQVGSLNGLCLVGGGAADPQFGFEYHLVGRDASGAIVDDRFECIAFPDGDTATRPPAPALPAVPTFGEAWNSVQLPAPTVAFDPPDRGITGLDTRISTAGPTTLVIAATIRGYTITGTATLDHYGISVDGGPRSVADTAHYTFETKGNHLVSVSAVWHGVATMTGPDLPAGLTAIDLGEATITSTRGYVVHEIRSVLQP
jgi:hypothetical protein